MIEILAAKLFLQANFIDFCCQKNSHFVTELKAWEVKMLNFSMLI
jgi:hypothetical protein